jgi:hypothetical protein
MAHQVFRKMLERIDVQTGDIIRDKSRGLIHDALMAGSHSGESEQGTPKC